MLEFGPTLNVLVGDLPRAVPFGAKGVHCAIVGDALLTLTRL